MRYRSKVTSSFGVTVRLQKLKELGLELGDELELTLYDDVLVASRVGQGPTPEQVQRVILENQNDPVTPTIAPTKKEPRP